MKKTELKKEIIIQENTQTFRIDNFLSKKYPDIPRRFFQNEIKNGNITINKKKQKPSYKLKAKDAITINIKYQKENLKIKPQAKIPLDIIFKNKDFLILEKPAGISVHPSITEKENTLANALLSQFPFIESIGEDPIRPGIVHRLDKETSGLLIICLNQNSFIEFKQLFKTRKIHKKYLALTWGNIKEKKFTINSYIGRSKSDPTKQVSKKNKEALKNPKNAITTYKKLKNYKDKTLLEAEIKTGRKHQIRAQLQSLGHPVVGDKKYFQKSLKKENLQFSRHLLHAYKLEFIFKNKSFKFESKKPTIFNV